MTSQKFIVAIDGPAGSGKSTICAHLSQTLKWHHVNTGKLYRAFAVIAAEAGVDLSQTEHISQFIQNNLDALSWDVTTDRIYYKSKELTTDLHSMEAGRQASQIAKYPRVRDLLLPLQQKLVAQAKAGLIVEGRDIGTVIAPQAQLKLFITANLEQRTKRRVAQLALNEKDSQEAVHQIAQQIENRDKQDTNRQSAPLRQAKDAVVIDTSHLDIETCIQQIVEIIHQRQQCEE